MKIVVSGASGFLGTELVIFLKNSGHQVKCLVRNRKKEGIDGIFWDPDAGKIDTKALEGIDAVVHLCGESIAEGRWTVEHKQRILDSRQKSTRILVDALCRLENPPKSLITASAVGYYGNRGAEHCNENSMRGTGFLSDVCGHWEAATMPAIIKGIHTVNLRFGIILSARGGVLAKMLPVFKWGLGGKLGNGRQYMSWVAIDDALGIINFALTHKNLSGPANVVTPYPITNANFTKILAKVLNRPAYFSVPEWILKLSLGKEMAEELLLCSTRVEPLRLTHAGYTFLYSDLEVALRHLLKKTNLGI